MKTISRRAFLRATAALAPLPFLPAAISPNSAAATAGRPLAFLPGRTGRIEDPPKRPAPAYTAPHEWFKLHLLAERQQTIAAETLVGATPEMFARVGGPPPYPNAINAFLLSHAPHRASPKNVLFDTGFGIKLFDNLKARDFATTEIDAVFLTHMHGDHIGGLLRDGAAAFPKAILHIERREYDYWINKLKAPAAIAVAKAYREHLELFDAAALGALPADFGASGAWDKFAASDAHADIIPIAAYGHTPGHTMYLVRNTSGALPLLIWGDLTHAMTIQLPFPEVAVTYDVAPAQAVATRKAVLQYAAKHGLHIAGMHNEFPAVGYVRAAKHGGYTFSQEKPKKHF
jgi:glyoxylase-like metal-dependent hydrolase (beta-lactamase superfamily II)